MAKDYRSLKFEKRDCFALLQKAYDRGYEQGKKDFKPADGYWSLIVTNIGAMYKCSKCKKHDIAPESFCCHCGTKMAKEVKS